MTLRIDAQSSVPVYRQIVDGLRILLVGGELEPGRQLPPVRRLAMDLGVHFNSVAEAYRALAAEGWLEITRRSGARVVFRKTPEKPDSAASEGFRRRLRELVAEVQSLGFPRGRIARELRRLAETLEEAR
jgi:GntR family transcriptional regulator